MDYDDLGHLRRNHPAWELLRADHAALILSFLGRVFIAGNTGSIPAAALAEALDDELYRHNGEGTERPYPRPAMQYLDDWTAKGWLRKHYPTGSTDAHYEVAPAVEQAVLWLESLRPRDFVGTASRLNTVIELLRQMVYGADLNPARRLEHLREQRARLDAEIERAERGEHTLLDTADQRDRYDQFSRTARELLADFRQVEENFRLLDRRMRERIAGWTGSKGELLDELVADRSTISESDQGRSFRSFYDLLLSPERRSELSELLSQLADIDAIPNHDPSLTHVHHAWIDASERTQATVRQLSEQVRRFIDDQLWVENRRVFDLLRDIEAKALALRAHEPAVEMPMDEAQVRLGLAFERPLFRRARVEPLATGAVEEAEDELDTSALAAQIYIDRERLLSAVLLQMTHRDQVELDDVIAAAPLEHGLAELVNYLALGGDDLHVVFDDEARARIGWHADDAEREADTPRVSYVAGSPADA